MTSDFVSNVEINGVSYPIMGIGETTYNASGTIAISGSGVASALNEYVKTVNGVPPTNGNVSVTVPTVPTKVSAFTNDSGYITNSALSGYQTTANLVTYVSSSSTNTQYPSARLLYDRTYRYITATSSKSQMPSWYRVWSDGWCEQGGITEYSQSRVSIVLTKPYSNANYTVIAVDHANTSDTGGVASAVVVCNIVSGGFDISQVKESVRNAYWYTCGYIS